MGKANTTSIHEKKQRDRQREALPSQDLLAEELSDIHESREVNEKENNDAPVQKLKLAMGEKKKKQLSITVDEDIEDVVNYVMDELKWKKKNMSKFINIVLINYLKSDPEIAEITNKNSKIKKLIEKL